MRIVYRAVTLDVINTYAFGEAEKSIDKDDLNFPFFKALEDGSLVWHWSLHIGWFRPLLEQLPLSFVAKTIPAMAGIFKMLKVLSSFPCCPKTTTKSLSLTVNTTRALKPKSMRSETPRVSMTVNPPYFTAYSTAPPSPTPTNQHRA